MGFSHAHWKMQTGMQTVLNLFRSGNFVGTIEGCEVFPDRIPNLARGSSTSRKALPQSWSHETFKRKELQTLRWYGNTSYLRLCAPLASLREGTVREEAKIL